MAFLDDQLPDFGNLQLPDNGMVFAPSTTSSPSTGGNSFASSVPTFLKAGGDVLSGIGGYIQGQQEAGADEYNASLALIQGQFEQQQIGLEETQILSTQKAMYAKAGVELTGSPLDTALNTATQYEYSKQVSQFNSQSQANMYDYEAKIAKEKGKFALAGGLLSGAMDLLPLALAL